MRTPAALIALAAALAATPDLDAATRQRLSTSTPPDPMTAASLPLHFEANRGQTDARVRFLARCRGYTVYITPTETVFTLRARSPHGLIPSPQAFWFQRLR